MVLVLITAAGLGYMTWDRNRDYRTAVGIWTDTVAKRPVNFRAHNNLGVALTRKGRYAEAVGGGPHCLDSLSMGISCESVLFS